MSRLGSLGRSPRRVRLWLLALAYHVRYCLAPGLFPSRGGTGTAKSLVAFSWAFPPAQATGAIVPGAVAAGAADQGWTVHVIAAGDAARRPGPQAATPSGGSLTVLSPSEEIRPSLDLKEATPQYGIPRIHGGFDIAALMAETAIRQRPGPPPAVIYASGPRFVNFVAAAMLKKHYGDRPTLVLQYRDEWTVYPPEFVSATPADRKFEAWCLGQADMVTFVTPGKLRVYRAAFPVLRDKLCLVHRNGVERAVLEGPAPDRHALGLPPDRLAIAFVGRATPEIPLIPFLRDLSAVLDERPGLAPRIGLVLVGDQIAENRAEIARMNERFAGLVTMLDRVDPHTAARIAMASDALLLLCNTRYDGVVPLKFFDYIATDRPILAYGTISEAARIVRDTGAGISIAVGQPASLADAVARLLAPETRSWRTPERTLWVERHDRGRIVADLLARCEALAAARRGRR